MDSGTRSRRAIGRVPPSPILPLVPQFLYRLHPMRLAMLSEGPTVRESAVLADHLAYLTRLAEEGTLLMAGRTFTRDERTFGIAVLVAPSETHARAVMENDPAVIHGVMRAELFPYRIALWSRSGPTQEGGP